MYYTKIKSIKKVGLMNAYDLHTPKYNNFFLANGILSHNSGKSYAAIRLAEKLDPTFDVSRVVFRPSDFMRLVKDLNTKGAVIIYDEAGVGMAARDWYSVSNKMLSYIFQTYRYKNLITFFTVPDFSFIDSHARKLVHAYFEPVGISRAENVSSIKPLLLKNNNFTGELFKEYLKARVDGELVSIKTLYFKLPSVKLRHAYEKTKVDFGTELYADALAQVGDDTFIPKKKLTPYQQEVYDLLRAGKSQAEICRDVNRNSSTMSQTVEAIRKKGYAV